MENKEENAAEKLVDMITDPEQEIEVYDDEKIFNIALSGAFAKRLNAVGAWMTERKDPTEILKIYEKLASDSDDKYDHFTFHFETMLILLREVEQQARNNGAIKKVKVKDAGIV
jgi:hypothetical protein